MPKTKKRAYDFFPLYEKFVRDSQSGKRLQPNGKRYSSGTVKNYSSTQKVLQGFCQAKSFVLRIFPEQALTKREAEREKNYWKKFHRRFTDYLYNDLGHFDNYVGATLKNVKTFFGYLQREVGLVVGPYYKSFYVRKEEIAIFSLLPEELNYLIYDVSFERSLSKRMQEVKDVFVFGCTVALRVSDLLRLKKSSIRVVNQQHYLTVRSQKTATYTLVKLPPYAISILRKYEKNKSSVLPLFNKSNLNQYIKQLLEKAGFTSPVAVYRERRGVPVLLRKRGVRFCDVVSTHTMRRTAITTMLCLGMPEQVVRKISGHAPGTKEFYRYVFWAQAYQDSESEKMFALLKEKKLQTILPC